MNPIQFKLSTTKLQEFPHDLFELRVKIWLSLYNNPLETKIIFL